MTAARLPDYRDNPFESDGIQQWQLWIVNQIKTHKGYWKWFEPEEYLSTEDSD